MKRFSFETLQTLLVRSLARRSGFIDEGYVGLPGTEGTEAANVIETTVCRIYNLERIAAVKIELNSHLSDELSETLKCVLDDYILCLSYSNTYIPVHQLERLVTQLCLMREMENSTRSILAEYGEKRTENDPTEEAILSEVKRICSTVVDFQPFQINPHWFWKYKLDRDNLKDKQLFFVSKEEFRAPMTFYLAVQNWYKKFSQYISNRKVEKKDVYILTELAVAQLDVPGEPDKRHRFTGFYIGERLEALDTDRLGSHQLGMMSICEWTNGLGVRQPPELFSNGVTRDAEEIQFNMEICRPKSVTAEVWHETAIVSIRCLAAKLSQPRISNPRVVAVISSYIRNPYEFIKECRMNNIDPLFLPPMSSRWTNPVESRVAEIAKGTSEYLWKFHFLSGLPPREISLSRLIAPYLWYAQKVYETPETEKSIAHQLFTPTLGEYSLEKCMKVIQQYPQIEPFFYPRGFWREMANGKAPNPDYLRDERVVRDLKAFKFAEGKDVRWKGLIVTCGVEKRKINRRSMATEYNEVVDKSLVLEDDLATLKGFDTGGTYFSSTSGDGDTFKQDVGEMIKQAQKSLEGSIKTFSKQGESFLRYNE